MKKVILAMFVALMLLSAVSVMADGSDPMPICRTHPKACL